MHLLAQPELAGASEPSAHGGGADARHIPGDGLDLFVGRAGRGIRLPVGPVACPGGAPFALPRGVGRLPPRPQQAPNAALRCARGAPRSGAVGARLARVRVRADALPGLRRGLREFRRGHLAPPLPVRLGGRGAAGGRGQRDDAARTIEGVEVHFKRVETSRTARRKSCPKPWSVLVATRGAWGPGSGKGAVGSVIQRSRRGQQNDLKRVNVGESSFPRFVNGVGCAV